jgi:hypothetical protein
MSAGAYPTPHFAAAGEAIAVILKAIVDRAHRDVTASNRHLHARTQGAHG